MYLVWLLLLLLVIVIVFVIECVLCYRLVLVLGVMASYISSVRVMAVVIVIGDW